MMQGEEVGTTRRLSSYMQRILLNGIGGGRQQEQEEEVENETALMMTPTTNAEAETAETSTLTTTTRLMMTMTTTGPPERDISIFSNYAPCPRMLRPIKLNVEFAMRTPDDQTPIELIAYRQKKKTKKHHNHNTSTQQQQRIYYHYARAITGRWYDDTMRPVDEDDVPPEIRYSHHIYLYNVQIDKSVRQGLDGAKNPGIPGYRVEGTGQFNKMTNVVNFHQQQQGQNYYDQSSSSSSSSAAVIWWRRVTVNNDTPMLELKRDDDNNAENDNDTPKPPVFRIHENRSERDYWYDWYHRPVQPIIFLEPKVAMYTDIDRTQRVCVCPSIHIRTALNQIDLHAMFNKWRHEEAMASVRQELQNNNSSNETAAAQAAAANNNNYHYHHHHDAADADAEEEEDAFIITDEQMSRVSTPIAHQREVDRIIQHWNTIYVIYTTRHRRQVLLQHHQHHQQQLQQQQQRSSRQQ